MPTEHCFQILGKLTFEPTDPPRPLDTYVIQRVPAGTGNVTSDPTGSLQIRRHVVGIDPNTPAQQANRAKVKAAVPMWHALTAEEKKAWRVKGEPRRISGFNAFLSAALRGLIDLPPASTPYAPPAGNAIALNLHNPYTPPAGDNINPDFT